jgi:CyaY protein
LNVDDMTSLTTSDTMNEPTFNALSSTLIKRVRDGLDACDPDVVECVPDAEVIKIVFPAGAPFVLNTQRPVREIWLAADRQAWHFRYDGALWKDKRSGDELLATLKQLITTRAGVDVVF